MAFLLSGPGMAVCIVGPCGSAGKKGSSLGETWGFNAAATLAAGLVVVATERALGLASEGRIREGSRAVLRIDKAMWCVRWIISTFLSVIWEAGDSGCGLCNEAVANCGEDLKGS